MKARTPFWPLLQHELGFGGFGSPALTASLFLIAWAAIGAFPLLVLLMENNARGNIATVFDAGFLPIMTFVYLGFLTAALALASSPNAGIALLLKGLEPIPVRNLSGFEFLFTRAIDRRKLFRARTTTFLILVMVPLLFDVAASPFVSKLIFAPGDSDPAAARRREHYLATFPGSHPRTVNAVEVPGQIVLSHGAEAYTAWVAWSTALAFLLLQAYGMLVARQVKPGNWRSELIPWAPMPILLLLFVLSTYSSAKLHHNFFEQSFLFFSGHWGPLLIALAVLAWIVQTWSERRFSQLEIL